MAVVLGCGSRAIVIVTESVAVTSIENICIKAAPRDI